MKTSSKLLAVLLCLVMFCSVTSPVSIVTQVQAASTSSTQKIELNKTKATVYNGKKLKLKVSGTKETVKWSSSKKTVATVKKGVVTAKKPGTTRIKAKVVGQTLVCKVTVKSALRTTKQEITLNKGESTKVTVVLYSEDGDVSCKIADRSIASYKFGNWNGHKINMKIKAKKAGTTTATISNTATSDKVTLTITVKDPTPSVTKKELTASAASISLDRGATKTVTLTAAPAAQILVSVAQPSIVNCKWNGNWNNDQSTVSLTGLSGGSTVVTLTNATTKESIKLNVTVNCKHVFSDAYKVETPATCTATGLEFTYCIYCGERGMTRSIPATGHSFTTAYTIDKPATCTSEGVQSRHCTKCSATTDVTSVPKAAHTFSAEFTVDVQPSCTTAGSKSRHCTKCDAKTEVTEIPATGHSFGEWVESGSTQTRTCSVCGFTESKDKDPLPVNNSQVLNTPLCSDENISISLYKIEDGQLFFNIENKTQVDYTVGLEYLDFYGKTYYDEYYVIDAYARITRTYKIDSFQIGEYYFGGGQLKGCFSYRNMDMYRSVYLKFDKDIETTLEKGTENPTIETSILLCEDENIVVHIIKSNDDLIHLKVFNKSDDDFNFGVNYLTFNNKTYYDEYYVTTVFSGLSKYYTIDENNFGESYSFSGGELSGYFEYYAYNGIRGNIRFNTEVNF